MIKKEFIELTKLIIVKLKKDYNGFKAGTYLYQDIEGENIVFDLRNYKKNNGHVFQLEEIIKNDDLFETYDKEGKYTRRDLKEIYDNLIIDINYKEECKEQIIDFLSIYVTKKWYQEKKYLLERAIFYAKEYNKLK
jgi:hypothetical protein